MLEPPSLESSLDRYGEPYPLLFNLKLKECMKDQLRPFTQTCWRKYGPKSLEYLALLFLGIPKYGTESNPIEL